MKYSIIFIVGPQGSGKGTQGKILATRLGFFYWEMGAVLREESNWKFTDGRTVGGIIDNGTLLSDDQLLEVFKAKMGSIPTNTGIVFDGIPRRIGQAKFLINYFGKQKRASFVTIFLDIPPEESMRRLLLRGKLEHRADDTAEGIERRLQMYEENTVPMLDYLRKHSVLLDVDGLAPIPDVTKRIADTLQLDEYKLYEKT